MTGTSLPTDGLIVRRADLAEALRIVAKVRGRRVSGATIRFEDGWLFVAAGDAIAKAPAQGVWPLTIIVGPAWVRRLAKYLPLGDPVFLRVENGRLYVNKYSEPCECSSEKSPLHPWLGGVNYERVVRKAEAAEDKRIHEISDVNEERRILKAATVLKPFRVGREDLDTLVATTRNRRPVSWQEDEQSMISAVSKAWALLAPFGVETSDLRSLVDGAVRNAWKVKKDK